MEDLKLKDSLGNDVNRPFFMGDVFDRDGSVCYCNNTVTAASGSIWDNTNTAIDATVRNDINCKSIRVDNLTIDDSIILRGVPLKDVCLGGRDIRSRLSTLKLGGTFDLC